MTSPASKSSVSNEKGEHLFKKTTIKIHQGNGKLNTQQFLITHSFSSPFPLHYTWELYKPTTATTGRATTLTNYIMLHVFLANLYGLSFLIPAF